MVRSRWILELLKISDWETYWVRTITMLRLLGRGSRVRTKTLVPFAPCVRL